MYSYLMKYRLIALDLDGTLLGPNQIVSDKDIDAIGLAQAGGAMVIPCTGRGWRESVAYLGSVPSLTHGVFNTGAVVSDMSTGATLDSADFKPDLALELVNFLCEMPDAVLVYQDANQTGCDYLICGRGGLTKETSEWCHANQLRTRTATHPTLEDLLNSVRISMVAIGAHGFDLEKQLKYHFGDRINLHCFAGVPGADKSKARFMVEIFKAGVDKWRGIKWLAEQNGIADHEIAAIGDEVNDLSMLRQAGLGVAMGNATESAKAAADRVTQSHREHGVSYALRQMLEGRW